MARFRNTRSGVVVTVADEKAHRFPGPLWERHDGGPEVKADGYSDQKVAELKAEIERRNAGRAEADHLPVTGNKADLVAALEADDEPTAPAADPDEAPSEPAGE